MLGVSPRAVRNLVAGGKSESRRDGDGAAARLLIPVSSVDPNLAPASPISAAGTTGFGGQPRKDDRKVPYEQITQLPDSVKNNLPKHAQEIYKEAFNSAEDEYGEESRAHRVAWSAVEQKYEKSDNGNWVQKDD